MHSVITPAGAITLGTAWLAATLLLGAMVLVHGARLTDVLAVAAASALVAALAGSTGSNNALALLLAPLCCVAIGVLTFRAAGAVLRGAERVARSGPVLPRLALVNLARSPGTPALVIAFIAVTTGPRLRPRLPVDADPQRGRPGGGPRPARRPCLARSGFQYSA